MLSYSKVKNKIQTQNIPNWQFNILYILYLYILYYIYTISA